MQKTIVSALAGTVMLFGLGTAANAQCYDPQACAVAQIFGGIANAIMAQQQPRYYQPQHIQYYCPPGYRLISTYQGPRCDLLVAPPPVYVPPQVVYTPPPTYYQQQPSYPPVNILGYQFVPRYVGTPVPTVHSVTVGRPVGVGRPVALGRPWP